MWEFDKAKFKEFLFHYLFPCLEKFKEEVSICEYFFVRYQDPARHLRVRIKMNRFDAAEEFCNVADALERCSPIN